jgi:hypothetical protein
MNDFDPLPGPATLALRGTGTMVSLSPTAGVYDYLFAHYGGPGGGFAEVWNVGNLSGTISISATGLGDQRFAQTFTKFGHELTNMVSILSVMRFPIVRCGIAGQKQSQTQSTTPSFSATHMTLWFASTIRQATWLRHTTTSAIPSNLVSSELGHSQCSKLRGQGFTVTYPCAGSHEISTPSNSRLCAPVEWSPE